VGERSNVNTVARFLEEAVSVEADQPISSSAAKTCCGFMQAVEDADSSFAFPTRTVHLVNDGSAGLAATQK